MNMKGGVGKTTLAVNIVYGLALLHKKNVLIVDADPQFKALFMTVWCPDSRSVESNCGIPRG